MFCQTALYILLPLLSTLSFKYNFSGNRLKALVQIKMTSPLFILSFHHSADSEAPFKKYPGQGNWKTEKETETIKVRRKIKAYNKTLKYNHKLWRLSELLSNQSSSQGNISKPEWSVSIGSREINIVIFRSIDVLAQHLKVLKTYCQKIKDTCLFLTFAQ